MESVIKWFHEDESFRQAAVDAHPLDFTDPDGVAGSLYMNMLDNDCKKVLSERSDAHGAGIYGMGAPSPALLQSPVRYPHVVVCSRKVRFVHMHVTMPCSTGTCCVHDVNSCPPLQTTHGCSLDNDI